MLAAPPGVAGQGCGCCLADVWLSRQPRGNHTLQPDPSPLPTARSENNVEQVALPSLPPGPVAITVRGHFIYEEVGAPQYALVVNGDFRWVGVFRVRVDFRWVGSCKWEWCVHGLVLGMAMDSDIWVGERWRCVWLNC